jgi:hypothetical protein
MSKPAPITAEQAIHLMKQNCEMLRATHNTLTAMINELNVEKNGLAHCNAFTLAAAQKTVYERWEQEKRKLAHIGQFPPSTAFASASEMPFPPDLRREIAEKATSSDYYKRIWGSVVRGT